MSDRIKMLVDVRSALEQLGLSYEKYAAWEQAYHSFSVIASDEEADGLPHTLKKTGDAR